MQREVARIKQAHHIFDDVALRIAHQPPRSQEGGSGFDAGDLRVGFSEAFDLRPFLAAFAAESGRCERPGVSAPPKTTPMKFTIRQKMTAGFALVMALALVQALFGLYQLLNAFVQSLGLGDFFRQAGCWYCKKQKKGNSIPHFYGSLSQWNTAMDY